MIRHFARAALASACIVVFAAASYAEVETVVVTASLREESEAPHLVIVKRADHVITQVNVTCDTRDPKQRVAELKETLRNMIHAATGPISIGLGDRILGDVTEANLDQIIESDGRVDTSHAVVVIKTTVSKDDTLHSATQRIWDFIAHVNKVGRTEVLRQGGWGLTLIGPEQYHDQLVSMILTEAKHTAETLGPGYAVSIDGLEHQVQWYQKGPLDLGLYLPYTLHIGPAGRN